MNKLILSITNEEYNRTISISIPHIDCTLTQFVEDLVIPSLQAYGYHHDNINALFNATMVYDRLKKLKSKIKFETAVDEEEYKNIMEYIQYE